MGFKMAEAPWRLQYESTCSRQTDKEGGPRDVVSLWRYAERARDYNPIGPKSMPLVPKPSGIFPINEYI